MPDSRDVTPQHDPTAPELTGARQRSQESPGPSHTGTPDAASFAAAVLAALTAMAMRTHRAQADVGAALRGAGLPSDAGQLQNALAFLQSEGCLTNFVPLSDGGLLVTVTANRPGNRKQACSWLPSEPSETAGRHL